MGNTKIIQERIHDLSSKYSQVVIAAVNTLSEIVGDEALQKDLIELVARSLSEETDPDDYAPLWVMVVLGRMGSLPAVPTLLTVLDTNWDIWMEAASEALESIASLHGGLVFPELEAYVLSHMDNDPTNGRLYVYSAIAAISDSDQAKRFLLRQYEEDDMWTDAIAHDLITLQDRTILPVLRRGITLARAFEEVHAEIESLEAYCLIDGMPDPLASFSKPADEAWSERWEYMLNKLSEPIQDKLTPFPVLAAVPEDDNPVRSLFESDDPFMKEMKKKNASREAWPLQDFCLKDYLAVRPRSDLEQQIEDALVLLGLSQNWTVEKLQALINASLKPSDALDVLLEDFEFPSTEAFESFSGLFMILWNTTPREEFQGLSPSEKRKATERTNITPIIPKKIPRNDPCPCGSGKKYKRCHLIGS